MAPSKESHDEWVVAHRHLQRTGFATCDVSNLLLEADTLRSQGWRTLSDVICSAARDVLHHRKLARVAMARAINAERDRRTRPRKKVVPKKLRTPPGLW